MRTLKILKLQILAACLILGQFANGANSCRVQVGVGRCFTKGPLSLKILALNGKDIFIREAAEERGDVQELMRSERRFRFKPTPMLDWLREIFRDNDPDIYITTEVHKDEDAKDFMELDTEGLKGKYWTFLQEGNSDRGINIEIGVKKDLGFKFKLRSYTDRRWTDPISKINYPLFSRSLPVLSLIRPGEDKPVMLIIGNHAKSKRDSPNDKESERYRTAQYEGIKTIMAELRAEFGENIPIILAGDFNTDTMTAPEMESIRGLTKSVFDSIAGVTFELKDRITHFFFGKASSSAKQMDDIRVAGSVKVLSAKVIKYTKANGEAIPDPKSFEERERLPSDHRPVIATVQVEFPTNDSSEHQ